MSKSIPKGGRGATGSSGRGLTAAEIRKVRADLAKRFPARPAAGPVKKEEWADAERGDVAAGLGRALPQVAYVKNEPNDATIAARVEVELPRFVKALVERKASDEEILREAHARVVRMPAKSGLLLLQALVTEFSRKPGSPVKVKDVAKSVHI